MTQIYIDGNDIKRNLSLEFDIDIDFDITYEQFVKDKNFDKIKHIIRGNNFLQIPFSCYFAPDYILNDIGKKLKILLNYDVIETYTGLTQYVDSIAQPFILEYSREYMDDLLNKKGWFYHEELDQLLNSVKVKMTNNQFVLKKDYILKGDQCDINMLDIKLLDKEPLNVFKRWNNPVYKTLKKKIGYTEEFVSNDKMEYMILVSLLTNNSVYLINNLHFINRDFVLVGEKELLEHINSHPFSTRSYIVENIFTGLHGNNLDHEKLLKDIREKYNKNNKDLKAVFKDIEEFVLKVGNSKLTVSFRDQKPMYMKGQFKTNDMNKYQELKEYTSDYGFVTEKNHKGSKKIIVGEKEFKYKYNKIDK